MLGRPFSIESKVMETAIIVALIATAASLIASLWSFIALRLNQRDIESLRFELAQQLAERNARRDYEYEARKRLYQEYEPLLFHLIEASENASNQIKRIAAMSRNSELQPDSPTSKNYFLKACIYHLLVPCAIFKLIKKRLTLVDLLVDQRIYTQYILAKTLYQSYADDFLLASLYRPLEYSPYVEGWRELRKSKPQVFRRQGFPIGRLDNALDSLILREEGKAEPVYTIVSFGQFEQELEKVAEEDYNSSLGVAKDMFLNFHPSTRPVLWRILITQALIYRSITDVSYQKCIEVNGSINRLINVSEDEIKEFDWGCGGQEQERKFNLEEPFHVAKQYLKLRVGPALKRRVI